MHIASDAAAGLKGRLRLDPTAKVAAIVDVAPAAVYVAPWPIDGHSVGFVAK
jgi:hypothetical protein